MFKLGEELQTGFGGESPAKERHIGYKCNCSPPHPVCPRLSKFPNLVKDREGVF